MNDTFKICALVILSAMLCIIIKNLNSSFALPTRFAGILILYGAIILFISPLVEYLGKIMGNTVSEENIELVLKVLSIAYITQITSDICRDCGENTFASGVDTIGKIEIIILSIPLIDEVIRMSEELALW